MKLATPSPGLRLVVQLGFGGSRSLISVKHPQLDETAFSAAVQSWLTERLDRLPAELKLTPRHFLCGISQIAIGADTVFAEACQTGSIPQRIFLTQHRDEYLSAAGSEGEPDFSPEQKRRAVELLKSPHIIQERVVAVSPDRHIRFKEVNQEIARVADVVVCLLRADAEAKTGGTVDLLAQAEKRQRPALKITVSVGPDGQPVFEECWVGGSFRPPQLPHELAEIPTKLQGIPSLKDYCRDLKNFGSSHAKSMKKVFGLAALRPGAMVEETGGHSLCRRFVFRLRRDGYKTALARVRAARERPARPDGVSAGRIGDPAPGGRGGGAISGGIARP